MIRMAKEENKTTLDDLAQMVARGFEQTASKADLKTLASTVDQLATKIALADVARKVDEVGAKLSAYVSQWRDEFEKLEERVHIVERTPRR